MYENDWQWIRKNWLMILLFLTLWVIVSAGLYQLFFFIPEDSEDDYTGKLTFSSTMGFILIGLCFQVYFKQKKGLMLLKAALQALRYLYPQIRRLHGPYLLERGSVTFPALRNISLYEWDSKKDIALGVVLESQGLLNAFSYENELEMMLKPLDGDEGLYQELRALDCLILRNVEVRIRKEFPREVYFLRLQLLNDFLLATREGKWLVYGAAKGLQSDKVVDRMGQGGHVTPEGKIFAEFFKVVLNMFYLKSKYQGYRIQPVSYNGTAFRDALKKIACENEPIYPLF